MHQGFEEKTQNQKRKKSILEHQIFKHFDRFVSHFFFFFQYFFSQPKLFLSWRPKMIYWVTILRSKNVLNCMLTSKEMLKRWGDFFFFLLLFIRNKFFFFFFELNWKGSIVRTFGRDIFKKELNSFIQFTRPWTTNKK